MGKFCRFLAVFLIVFTFPVGPVSAFGFSFSDLFVDKVAAENASVEQRKSRIQSLKMLIQNSKNDSDWQKINKVNQFFNRINYMADKDQWGVEDYWASPEEFLSRNAGDCEDYSIAKYFTLKAMGVSIERLRITYVTSLPSQQAHMVLVYFEGTGPTPHTPLVLDNLKKTIEPLSIRTDLDPVYSFNNDGLWLASRNGANDELVGTTKQISHWQRLSAKVVNEALL